MTCEKLEFCPFFQKHASRNPVGCHSLVLRFCKGSERALCARDEFYRTYGRKPSDDMTPLGTLMDDAEGSPPDVGFESGDVTNATRTA